MYYQVIHHILDPFFLSLSTSCVVASSIHLTLRSGVPTAAAAGPGWMCWVCKEATEKGKANTPAVAAAAATAPPDSVKAGRCTFTPCAPCLVSALQAGRR